MNETWISPLLWRRTKIYVVTSQDWNIFVYLKSYLATKQLFIYGFRTFLFCSAHGLVYTLTAVSRSNSFWNECVVVLSSVAIFCTWFKSCLCWSTDFVPVMSEDVMSKDMRQRLGMPGWNDFSRVSNTSRNSVRWVIRTDWGRRRLELMPFIPKEKGFFYVTFLVSWEYLFWPLSGLDVRSTLVLWTPDWPVSSVCLLSFLSQFQGKYQKAEIWTVKSSFTAWHPLQLLHLQSLNGPTHFASQMMSGDSGGNPECFFRILVIESSPSIKIWKSFWD